MIAIPTVNPPGVNYDRFVAYVSNVMKSLGMELEIIEVPRDLVESVCDICRDYARYIVIGRLGGGRPLIQFNGHYDVVPPGEGWSCNPFKSIIEGGKVYGRGAVDMKGGIAATFLAITAFREAFKEFSGTIEIALVPDEEIGGVTGTGYLLKVTSKTPDYVIVAEPSGSRNIWIGHKGALWGYIRVFGRQSHGSTPWRGVNAFDYMARIALEFMERHNSIISRRISRYDYGDPRGARPTLNLGGEVRGSTKINIVPGYYEFSFDRRVIPEESLEDVEKEIREIIEAISKEMPEVRIDLKIVNRLNPAITSEDSVLVKTLEKSIELVQGSKPRKIVCLGGLDLHYYTERGIQAVAYGPGPDEMAHAIDEYVLIDEIVKVAHVYVHLMRMMLNVDRFTS